MIIISLRHSLVQIQKDLMLQTRRGKKAMFLVDYWTANSKTNLKCSCQIMEKEGLSCSHIFIYWDILNKLYEIPKCCCIMRRHSKAAKGQLPSTWKIAFMAGQRSDQGTTNCLYQGVKLLMLRQKMIKSSIMLSNIWGNHLKEIQDGLQCQ